MKKAAERPSSEYLTEVVPSWTARIAFLAGAGLVGYECASCEFSAVHGLDGFTSFIVVGHFNETETAGAAGCAIDNHRR